MKSSASTPTRSIVTFTPPSPSSSSSSSAPSSSPRPSMSTSTPTPTRTRSLPKTVKFNEFTTIREIQSLGEISDKELSDVWYNEDEYTEIKNHVTETMKKVSNGELLCDDDGWCLRGLEGRTKFGSKRRHNNKAKALEAVWSTQIALWKQRIDSPAIIAAAYKPHSTNAKYPAIARARIDELSLKDESNNNT